MISSLLLGLLKFLRAFFGIVLAAAAILGGATCLGIVCAMTYVYFSSPRMAATDVSLWRWNALATPIFALLIWAGFRLANAGRAPRRPRAKPRFSNGPPPLWAQCFVAVFWLCFAGFGMSQMIPGEPAERGRIVVALFAGTFLMLHLRLLLHLTGHLVAGALLGMQPVGLQVGHGFSLLHWTTRGGFQWEWRLWPAGGWANNVDRNARPEGWRFFGMTAGGPLADVLFAALVLLALHQLAAAGRIPFWLTARETHPSILQSCLILLSVPMVAGLLPTRFARNGALLHSDGWWLLKALFLPAAKLRRTVFTMAAAYIVRLWTAGRQEQARAEMDDVIARYPDQATPVALLECELHRRDKNPTEAEECFQRALEASDTQEFSARASAFAEYAALLARTGNPDGARTCCASLLSRTTDAGERARLLDEFASMPLLRQGARALLPDAERWCAEAMALAPDEITLRGTWGSLLVELGRAEEAMPILQEVLATTRSDNDRGIASFYLALAAKRLGRRREARTFRALARRLCKTPVLLGRLRTELHA